MPFARPNLEQALANDPLGDFFIEWDCVWEDDALDLEGALNAAKHERDMQAHLDANPFLLIQHLGGGHGRYVLSQQRLGCEYVTDFLICERDSLGFHWTAVEIESPLAPRARSNGEPSAELHHAINQIQDWRRWLTAQIAYARTGLKLSEIDGTVPGLVIMGRRGDGSEPERLRQISEQNCIAVHSYDWLLSTLRAKLEGPRFSNKSPRPDAKDLVYRHFRGKTTTSTS